MPDYNQEVVVEVVPSYLAAQSVQDEQRYVFSYKVNIYNRSHQPVKLLHRHWLITDGNGQIQEVHGEGVIGQQPIILPNESYHYESGSVLSTLIGSMQGHYEMVALDQEQKNSGEIFKVEIPIFTLSVPNVLN